MRVVIWRAIGNWQSNLVSVRNWMRNRRWSAKREPLPADEANVASAQLQLESYHGLSRDAWVWKQVDVGSQISSSDTAGIVVIT